MCIHIFLLNSLLRWSSVLYDFSYCMRSDSFGLWHCSIFSCCLKKGKKRVWRGLCRLAPSALPHRLPGCREVKDGQRSLPVFQHHSLLTGHCFPKRYYCFRLSLKGDVTFTVTSATPGRSALRSGVYNFTFSGGWLADTAAGCSWRRALKSSSFT